MKAVYWLKELSKNALAIAGGKGANLAEMYNIGLPVPEAFVVSAGAYFDFIKSTGVEEVIRKELAELDVQDSAKLQAASERIKKAIVAQQVPQDTRVEVVKAYNKLCGADLIPSYNQEVFIAVRSSATAEDLPSISGEEPVLVVFDKKIEFLKMRELWRKYEQNPSAEILVPALEESRIVWKRVQEIYSHPVKTKLVKITTKTGREITITPDHSLVVLDTDTMQPKPAGVKDLSRDTRIPVLKKMPFPELQPLEELDVAKELGCELVIDERGVRIKKGKWSIQKPFPAKIPLTEDFAYFLGAFAAEGSTYESNCVDVSCESKEMAAKVRNFFESIGLKTNHDENNVRVFSKPLVRLLHKLFGAPEETKGKGRYSRTKKVPDLVFNSSKEFIQSYLRGYFDGDGYVSDEQVSVTSVSRDLLAGTALLLSLLGIKSYVRETDVVISSHELKSFLELIGCTEEAKKRKLEKIIAKYDSKEKHNYELDSFPASKKIAEVITETASGKLPAIMRNAFACPACSSVMHRNGKSSSGKQRWMCEKCGASVSEGRIPLKTITYFTHSAVDASGRFTSGFAPWNKGKFVARPYSRVALQKIALKLNSRELMEMTSSDVIWDKIEKIEEIDYEGLVYDFVVPGPQNFLAGFGGVITHNTASFAGQQATFLNVKGSEEVVKAVKKCWASLFEARAIYYRDMNKFEHLKVGLAAIVQRMVQSDKSGVMFTVDPVTNDESLIVIEAGYGLGEAIVSGLIIPDLYKVDKATWKLASKEVFKQETMITKVREHNEQIEVPSERQEEQKLSDEEIFSLADYGRKIEEHYDFPQDIEWAVEKGRIYIVQTRPVTTLKKKQAEKKMVEGFEEKKKEREEAGKQMEGIEEIGEAPKKEFVEEKHVEIPEIKTVFEEQKGEKMVAGEEKIILKGLPASPGVASGVAKLISSPKELNRVKQGDVLVTQMTNPDYVPAMKRAIGIVTDEGGMTCHAAIVARELGIPCVVGTREATKKIKDGQVVSIDARTGIVYEGKVDFGEEEKSHAQQVAEKVVEAGLTTGTRIYVNLAEPENAEVIAKKNVDGVGLFRAEFLVAAIGVHPRKLIKEHREEEFISALAKGMRKVCGAFNPRPVIYRATDFKTNEYKNLEGGAEFEPHEENPMIGYRGCFRYIKEPDEFALEVAAIKRVREQYGLRNLWLMIPFVRTVDEFKICKRLMEQNGLHQTRDFKLGIMCEIPSTVILAEEFCKAGADFFSIGSNDLTQLTLGIDRDNPIVAEEFDERDLSIIKSLKHVITTCHKYNVTIGICGQAPSVYPEFTEKIVEFGIDSISVNPDVIDSTRKIVSSAEKKILLKKARETHERLGQGQ
jgi:pyruvate,water dikinase